MGARCGLAILVRCACLGVLAHSNVLGEDLRARFVRGQFSDLDSAGSVESCFRIDAAFQMSSVRAHGVEACQRLVVMLKSAGPAASEKGATSGGFK